MKRCSPTRSGKRRKVEVHYAKKNSFIVSRSRNARGPVDRTGTTCASAVYGFRSYPIRFAGAEEDRGGNALARKRQTLRDDGRQDDSAADYHARSTPKR